ncbi:MAG: GtrA family protein [Carbonactinosporaceae bacterium]
MTSLGGIFPLLAARLDRVVRELMKFGVVGAAAFCIDIGGFNLLRTTVLEDGTVTAKVISVTAATVASYLGNRHWTWRHRTDGTVIRGFTLFTLCNLAGMAIAVACLGFSHYALGFTSLVADNLSGNVIGTGLATLFRFWSYRTWVFPEVPTSTGERREPAVPR